MRWLVCATLALVVLSACRDGSTVDRQELLVSAAASLTDVFADIELAFEQVNPEVDVVLNLAGSSTLREQILAGAPADVFASANTEIMAEVVDAGETSSEPEVFAVNRLQIAVPAGNPGRVTGLEDFSNADLLLGICARGVPCGDFARQSLAKAGVDPELDTAEPNVRALLVKIEAGELDAGITYVTDVIASGESVEGIDIPVEVNVTAEYPIAVLANAPNPDTAADFVSFVQTEPGREILENRGFATP